MEKVVISLGGSILLTDRGDIEYLRELSKVLIETSLSRKLLVVTGGGGTARKYITLGRELGVDEATLDWQGICASRLNSWLVIGLLGDICYPRPFETLEEGLAAVGTFRITVGGGTHPGHTTDAVSALMAERWRADQFLNLTAVEGAYTADPNVNPDAERIERMTSGELVDLVSLTSRGAGSHSVMDPLAAHVIHRAGITTSILNGRDLSEFRKCIDGEKFKGTIVIPDRGGERS